MYDHRRVLRWIQALNPLSLLILYRLGMVPVITIFLVWLVLPVLRISGLYRVTVTPGTANKSNISDHSHTTMATHYL